ncbi:hypothetical protein DFH07DRAFT_992899 [Mycena maculata]|uniref:RRM domain-containing protein n=1 Tax=Mycena maculata TaxID=230809 RepID=A0AAD7HZQ4_9AGAR|nr:hypothetical protein DFH07DRAFT_992899 [Mycena maculata]
MPNVSWHCVPRDDNDLFDDIEHAEKRQRDVWTVKLKSVDHLLSTVSALLAVLLGQAASAILSLDLRVSTCSRLAHTQTPQHIYPHLHRPRLHKHDLSHTRTTAANPRLVLLVRLLVLHADIDANILRLAIIPVAMDRNTGQLCGHHGGGGGGAKDERAEIDGRRVNIDYGRPADKSKVRENCAKTFSDLPSEPSVTLFVGNLSFDEDTVWRFFNECSGSLKSVRILTDRDTGRPKGFGCVELEDIEGAKKAYEAANGQEIEGHAIRLDYSQLQDASGGGGGGRGGF